MTLSLFILRHGKAGWNSDQGDHERTLTSPGPGDAGRIGRLLTSAGVPPDLVLSSSAVRARTTAEIAFAEGAWTCPLEFSRELYEATPTTLLDRLLSLESAHERVLLVGHQPTLSELVGVLSGSAAPGFPTATLARIDFELETWSLVAPGTGRLMWLIPARALGD
jgi:phosphohistidine phosphatase